MNFPIQLLLKAAIVVVSLLSNKYQAVMLGLIHFILLAEFSYVLSVKPYDLDKIERGLRNAARYFISLSFMHLFLLVGQYMDEDLDSIDEKPTCDGKQPIAKSVFVGLLKNEDVHFWLGYS